jgi:hypothetical protein
MATRTYRNNDKNQYKSTYKSICHGQIPWVVYGYFKMRYNAVNNEVYMGTNNRFACSQSCEGFVNMVTWILWTLHLLGYTNLVLGKFAYTVV